MRRNTDSSRIPPTIMEMNCLNPDTECSGNQLFHVNIFVLKIIFNIKCICAYILIIQEGTNKIKRIWRDRYGNLNSYSDNDTLSKIIHFEKSPSQTK